MSTGPPPCMQDPHVLPRLQGTGCPHSSLHSRPCCVCQGPGLPLAGVAQPLPMSCVLTPRAPPLCLHCPADHGTPSVPHWCPASQGGAAGRAWRALRAVVTQTANASPVGRGADNTAPPLTTPQTILPRPGPCPHTHTQPPHPHSAPHGPDTLKSSRAAAAHSPGWGCPSSPQLSQGSFSAVCAAPAGGSATHRTISHEGWMGSPRVWLVAKMVPMPPQLRQQGVAQGV